MPHPPQLFGSFPVFTHVPEQLVWPKGQGLEHTPIVHVGAPPPTARTQRRLHPPQFVMDVSMYSVSPSGLTSMKPLPLQSSICWHVPR